MTIWIVHCLHGPTGRALIGVADTKKNANFLSKEMCSELISGDEVHKENFSIEMKKVVMNHTNFKKIVIDLT